MHSTGARLQLDLHPLRTAPDRPRPSPRPSPRLSVGAGLMLLLLAGCGTDLPDKSPHPTAAVSHEAPLSGGAALLTLDFNTVSSDGTPITSLKAAAGEVVLRSVTAGAGRLIGAPDRGNGAALAFPTAADVSSGNLAIVEVTAPAGDPLAPGDDDYQFGVDLMYPEGAAGDSAGDNGDNLLQRGLFGDQGQYKLQVDHGRPACRMAGDGDEVLVKSTEPLDAGVWYRLVCQRAANKVTLFQAELPIQEILGQVNSGQENSATLAWDSWSRPDHTGSITAATTAVPVSIGGKLNASGGIVVEAPDQFSGVLDNVRITRLP